jgi:hypothetical protein
LEFVNVQDAPRSSQLACHAVALESEVMVNRLAIVAAAVAALGASQAAHATSFFTIDPNPGGAKLFLDSAKNSASSNGTVVTADDVAISATGNADFASGFSTIKPIKDGSLTTLVFTPVDPNEFDAFSFRGQDLLAGQVIDVTVQDNQGDAAETFQFTEGNASQDFARIGIAALDGTHSIQSVTIYNSGGFKEAKQFEFGCVTATADCPFGGGGGGGGGVPEPASWALMLIGVGGMGAALRRRRVQATATA